MQFQCPNCHGIIAVDNSDLGYSVQCGNCFETVNVPPSRVMPGTVVGDFLILEQLGNGGMGVVFKAHQISLDRPAALKVLSENLASNHGFITGFIKEARAAAQLNHPHIVQAFAVGDDDGIFYFAMEYVDGETMKEILKRERIIPCDFAISVMLQISEALDYAWKEANIVHRDIKPDNIMITSSLKAKLADLGLARSVEDMAEEEGSDEVLGTPQYISPEQLTGAPIDNRTDIYSLGATFYHLVTGRFPFEGSNALEIAQKHLAEELVPPHLVNPSVPEMVSLVICKMMAKNPIERYQTAEELVEDLNMVKKGKLPPKLASRHGGGFAGKTLILVNDRNHTTTRQVTEPAPKKSSMPLIFGGVAILILLAVGVILMLSGKSDTPSIEIQRTYAEKAMAIIDKVKDLQKTDVNMAIDELHSFLSGNDEPLTEQDFLRQAEVRALYTRLEEANVVAKSTFRQNMYDTYKAEFNKIQSSLK